MKKVIKALALLISFTTVVFSSELMSFKKLTELASKDLGKNIYLDKDLPKYSVEFNLVDHQKKGEVYEFYKIVLFENDMILQYNRRGDFYFIKEKKPTVEPLVAPEPMPVHETLKLHYYTYKIKHITNEDVVDSMAIFPNVKYKYLKQSDMIAYSATRRDHESVKRILRRSDNEVLHKTIKITLFAINKKNLLAFGSSINAFEYNFDGSFDGIISAFRSGNASVFELKDNFAIGFTLHALQGHSLADIFQSPTMRLTNGVESSVTSVMNVPYLQTTAMVDSTTNSVTEQYEYKDIGLQIKVMPKIKDDWIYLNLNLISEELLSLLMMINLSHKKLLIKILSK